MSQPISEKTITLSVLLPIYNVKQYLGECLEHIRQGLIQGNVAHTVEVIMLDDGSTDDSLACATAWLESLGCSAHVVVNQHNQGIGVARNLLLDHANGQYIWFVDPDDMPVLEAFCSLFEIIESFRPELIVFDWLTQNDEKCNQHGVPRTRRRRGAVGEEGLVTNDSQKCAARVLLQNKLYVWNKVFKRSLVQNLSFPALRFYEDLSFSTSLLLTSQRTYFLRKPLIIYRHRAGSVVNSMDYGKLQCWHQALEQVRGIVAEVPDPHQELMVTASYCLYHNYYELLRNYAATASSRELLQVYREVKANVFISFFGLFCGLLVYRYLFHAWRIVRKYFMFLGAYRRCRKAEAHVT